MASDRAVQADPDEMFSHFARRAPVERDLPDGEIVCEECHGDPVTYSIDHELPTCPHCHGLSHVPDPDWTDPADVFDPKSEWGTLRAVRDRVVG